MIRQGVISIVCAALSLAVMTHKGSLGQEASTSATRLIQQPVSGRGAVRPDRVDGPRKVAVLVGVNEYKRPGFSKLGYAVADVEEVGAELKSLGFNVHLLPGPKATRANIHDTIDQLAKQLSGPEDLMFVMLAGHGQQLEVEGDDGTTKEEAFFCPYDAIASSPPDLVSLSYLIDTQLTPRVKRNIVVVDACRNVPRTRSRGIQGRIISLPEDTAVLYSCRAGQQSYEIATLGHGIFSFALLDALRGGAAREGKIVWSSVVAQVDWLMASPELRKYMRPGAPQVPISAGGVPIAILGEGNWKTQRPTQPDAPAIPMADDYEINSVGMRFVRVPAGRFEMGSSMKEAGRDLDEWQHEVTITRPFYLGVFEVSQAEYETVMGTNPSYFRAHGDGSRQLAGPISDQLPVEQVSWQDAMTFCSRLSARPEEAEAKRRYRLPTEAEWEYACRAKSTTAFHFGNPFDPSKANVDAQYPYGGGVKGQFLGRSVDVAMYGPNAFGLHNMHGNVSEWCDDWYDMDYYQSSASENRSSDPTGPPSGTGRVLRGGSWFDHPMLARSADRQSADPDERTAFNGFRVVCDLIP